MKRSLPTLISLLLLSGCATTGSRYYNDEGSGDYYYGANAADAVISASPYGYGSAGSNFGYGYGLGAGFGYGYGYGGGYANGGGYGWPYSYSNYGYRPIWFVPSHPQHDAGFVRDQRVQRDQVVRAGFVRRDTVQAPVSAKWQRTRPSSPAPFFGSPTRRAESVGDRSSPRVAPARRSSAPMQNRTFRPSPPPMIRSAPQSAPMRSTPAPRPSPRRQ